MRNLKLQTGMVYGPVGSRRIGLSLGVNLSPTSAKQCSFNCVYCHYGWTKVLTLDSSAHQENLPDVNDLARQLEEYETELYLIDHITFSGNGEATCHPHFARAVDIVNEFRDKHVKQAKTAILSNSSTVMNPSVRKALLQLDRRIMKLDAGDDKTFRKINRPPAKMKLQDIISGLKELADFETQTIFIDGSVTNADEKAVQSWLKVIKELQPKTVQIYTLDRPPADSNLTAVNRDRMRDIFMQAKKAGLPVHLY